MWATRESSIFRQNELAPPYFTPKSGTGSPNQPRKILKAHLHSARAARPIRPRKDRSSTLPLPPPKFDPVCDGRHSCDAWTTSATPCLSWKNGSATVHCERAAKNLPGSYDGPGWPRSRAAYVATFSNDETQSDPGSRHGFGHDFIWAESCDPVFLFCRRTYLWRTRRR